MKTVVIVSHPNIASSSTQQFLKEAAAEPDVTWHVLTDQPLDITAEQALVRDADRLIFQFPLYWYSAPASLKAWEDTVLTRSFTYPSVGGALVGKELGLVISLGQPAAHYAAGAPEQFSVSQLTTPYQALAHRLGMTWLPSFVVDQFGYQTETEKMHLLVDYQRYLTQNPLTHFSDQVNWTLRKLKAVSETQPEADQQKIGLVIDQISQNAATLSDLQDTLALLKDGGED